MINPAQEKRVREDVMKLLDQRENEYLPQVSIDIMDVGHFFLHCKLLYNFSRTLNQGLDYNM